jgi:hypothetical protein
MNEGELIWGKGTIGLQAAVPKKPHTPQARAISLFQTVLNRKYIRKMFAYKDFK